MSLTNTRHLRARILTLTAIALLAGCATQPAPESSPSQRIAARTFPSVFQAWNPADNLKCEDSTTTLARHDLVFHDARFFHLRYNNVCTGLATGFDPSSLPAARQRRQQLLAKNPNLILLAEIRYRDAPRDYLPPDHPWWRRASGQIVKGWDEGDFLQLDFSNPQFRQHVARQAKALIDTGVCDGVMLDWWDDDDDRLALIQAIRSAVGDNALILVNANDRTTPRTAPYVNGYFMECYRSKTPQDWHRIADTLQWAERNLRQPHINCTETWWHNSRQDLGLMRATTTLVLTISDGYCLFSDPNPLPTPDHLHNWYDFWNKSLGKPTGPGVKQPDGSYRREFDHGTVIYNPPGNQPIAPDFPTPRRRASTHELSTHFTIPPSDGEIFLLP